MARLVNLNLQVTFDERLERLRRELQEACNDGRIYGILGIDSVLSAESHPDASVDEEVSPQKNKTKKSGIDFPFSK